MRLISALKRVEGRAEEKAAVRRRQNVAWGIAWTEAEQLLDRELGDGESLAVDVHVLCDDPRTVRTVERATLDAADLGIVYGIDGVVIGRVEPGNGRVMRIETTGGSSAA